jgi:hypothetical protein
LLRLPVAQFDGIEGRSAKFITQTPSLEWLATVLALRSDSLCIRLNSVGSRPGERLQMKELLAPCKSFGRFQSGELTMEENKDLLVTDLHTKAAYAHMAAAHQHSSGDHASAEALAKMALRDSREAVKCTEEIAKGAPQTMQS